MTKSPGHELAHIIDNLNSALRIFEEFDNISEAEKLEIVLSCLGHDLGRHFEKEFDTTSNKDTLFLVPALIGRRIRTINRLPDSLQLRILFDIASGPVQKTGHRTADAVHQCDREQLTGSRVFARGLEFGYILSDEGRELTIPLREEFSRKLPMPESSNDRWLLVAMEFFMRNVYPPSSPKGQAEIDKMKQDNAVIELLATTGKQQEFEQVFAPELELVDPKELDWSKKPIPREVFEAAIDEKDEFLKRIDMNNFSRNNVLELVNAVMATENLSFSPEYFEKMGKKLKSYTDDEVKNLWLVLQYVLLNRHTQRTEDIQRLEKTKESKGIAAIVAGWVLDEFQSREETYHSLG